MRGEVGYDPFPWWSVICACSPSVSLKSVLHSCQMCLLRLSLAAYVSGSSWSRRRHLFILPQILSLLRVKRNREWVGIEKNYLKFTHFWAISVTWREKHHKFVHSQSKYRKACRFCWLPVFHHVDFRAWKSRQNALCHPPTACTQQQGRQMTPGFWESGSLNVKTL